MKLEKLQLKGFKNLVGRGNLFKLDFVNNSNSTVLIGSNGSGKSNVIEAISSIFNSLFRKDINSLTFEFDLYYSVNDIKYRISKKEVIKYRKQNRGNATYTEIDPNEFYESHSLPEQVIALYSGEETRLWETYYKDYYLQHNDDVIHRRKTVDNEAKLLFINKYYWDIALLTLFISEINIDDILDNYFLDSVEFQININNLNKFKAESYNEVVSFIDNFYFDKDGHRISDTNSIKIEKDDFINRFDGETHKRLFNLLCVAKLPKVDDNRLIDDIKLNFSNDISASDFSEGEKKKILLKLILASLAEDNTLVLLDEPDSHIHVAHKKQIKEMIENSQAEIVLTTHSPTLMNIYNEQLVYLENGKLQGKARAEILKEISGDSMSLAEQQIVLNSTNDILLVEGKLDIIFIQEALKRLDEYSVLQDMILIPTGGASGLRLFIDKFTAKDNQNIIAILDNDKAGKDEVKAILTDNDYRVTLDRDGYVKIDELKNTYLLLLPKPENVTNSQYEIEDYFPLSKLVEVSKTQIDTFRVLKDFIIKKDFVKKKLSEECKNESYIKEDFTKFKKLFDLIKTIKGS